MAKENKQFKINFKPVNAKLRATRNQLKKIQEKVTQKDRKAIAAQIKAIDVLLAACAAKRIGRIIPPMSAAYTEK